MRQKAMKKGEKGSRSGHSEKGEGLTANIRTPGNLWGGKPVCTTSDGVGAAASGPQRKGRIIRKTAPGQGWGGIPFLPSWAEGNPKSLSSYGHPAGKGKNQGITYSTGKTESTLSGKQWSGEGPCCVQRKRESTARRSSHSGGLLQRKNWRKDTPKQG